MANRAQPKRTHDARTLSYQTAAAREKRQPIEVTIDDVTIRFRSVLPLPELVDIAQLGDLTDDEGNIKSGGFPVLLETLERLVVPDSQQAWRDKLSDPTAPLDVEVLVSLISDLVPMLVGRPTEEPSSSDGS